jgi:DNA-binding sugar fermentation-stimulating protein
VRLPPLVAGRFVRRDNRFRVTVDVEGEPAAAHLPNSGRLTELLTPGRACWLARFDDSRRKTRFDLVLVAYAGVLVSVDARLPNVFVIQRPDARCFTPHDRADAAFGAALREAQSAGVGVYAWACEVRPRSVIMGGQVSVELT